VHDDDDVRRLAIGVRASKRACGNRAVRATTVPPISVRPFFLISTPRSSIRSIRFASPRTNHLLMLLNLILHHLLVGIGGGGTEAALQQLQHPGSSTGLLERIRLPRG